jgi:hypothetical protein
MLSGRVPAGTWLRICASADGKKKSEAVSVKTIEVNLRWSLFIINVSVSVAGLALPVVYAQAASDEQPATKNINS